MRAAVTGTFDGVHRGHQFLLHTLRAEAGRRGLEPLAVTFTHHPQALLNPEKAPLELTQDKLALLRQQGVEVVQLDFKDLRAMTAVEFLSMLRRQYGVTLFLLGFNNRIGSDRVGVDSPQLAEVAQQSGVEILPATEHPDGAVSSTAIRQALAEGRIEDANAMLGRPYEVTGVVVTGRQIGRTIDFPTANIAVPRGMALPKEGVYVGGIDGRRCVVNVGRRPTVEGRDDAPLSVEAHILDFHGDLYGHTLTLQFLHRLRGERRFGSLEELKAAIAADVTHARKYEPDI